MPAMWMWLTNHSDSQLFGVIVGAVIGGVIGIIANLLAVYGNYRSTIRVERDKRNKKRSALRNGLLAEIIHVDYVIGEIMLVMSQSHQVCTKRINSDVVGGLRLVLPEYEDDLEFLVRLTNAYRDIVHTNNMLDDLEVANTPGNQTKFSQLFPSVIASLKGAKGSVEAVREKLEKPS